MEIAPVQFDATAFSRHDGPGPRYTSYPPAPRFHPGFGETQLREAIALGNGEPIPRRLSLYIHVPFCQSPCFYCGCNRIITRDFARGRDYLAWLEHEIDLYAELFDGDREVIQLHLGGGTPNFLAPEDLARLVELLQRRFRFSTAPDRDLSIELDPRFIDAEGIAILGQAGFNRASLGVQDLDPAVQKAVNREQSAAEIHATVEACRASGFRSVNLDLIYGLPLQTPQSFERTLHAVAGMRPDRLAVYAYAHMPQMFRAQRQIDEAELPDRAQRLELLQLAIETLTAAGYVYIGMDHFARPGDDLAKALAAGTLHRNFMGYTTHADCDLLGMGVSAISHVGETFSQNPRDITGWKVALAERRLPVFRGLQMDGDDRVRAEVIQSLMCRGEVDIAEMEQRHEVDFPTYFWDALLGLRALEADGIVQVGADRIVATPRGRLLLKAIARCFDREFSGN